MKPTIASLVIIAAALALSGEPPKPVAAAPVDAAVSDGPRPLTVAEFEQLQDALRKWRDAENEVKRLQEELAKTAVSPEPVALVATAPAASGGVVCLSGNCGAAGSRRVFTGQRRPVRRLLGRFDGRPRLFGRM